MLRDRRVSVRPAENPLLVAHHMNAEVTKDDLFQIPIGRVILNPLHVAAEPVPLVQNRTMGVGEPRRIIHLVGSQLTEPLQMRLQVIIKRRVEIEPQ